MFRFTIRDVLWLMVVVGLGSGWWIEHRKAVALKSDRDEAVSRWHDASIKWVEATKLIPASPLKGGLGGMKESQPTESK
jgi:hypothetical protein